MVGRPKKVTDEDVLRQIKLCRGPIATNSELQEALDMSSTGVNQRLNDLVDRELVNKQRVGANAIVYWVSDDGEDYLAGKS